MMKTFALTLIAVGLGAGVASAEPVTVYGSSAPTAQVSYADINLASASGVDRLRNRVRAAASGLCLEPVKEDLAVSSARRMCFRTAVSDGFTQIDRLVADRLAGKSSLTTAILISAR